MSIAAVGGALWLGILTSISPCPLATNIAAIAFIGRRVDSARHVLFSGLLYTLGRTAAYVALAAVLLTMMLASGQVSQFLQRYFNMLVGPVLIVAGALLLGLLGPSASLNLAGQRLQQRVAQGGLWWSVAVGAVFALSFCPVSAGLYFGGLIPLAAKSGDVVLLPAVYGAGTALPVLVFAFIIAFASQWVGRAFNCLAVVEKWMRLATGIAFVLAGMYLCLTNIYGLSPMQW